MSETKCPNCGHVFDPALDPDWATGVRRRRMASGISLRVLASSLGLSPAYVSDIERCRRNKPAQHIVAMWERFLEPTP